MPKAHLINTPFPPAPYFKVKFTKFRIILFWIPNFKNWRKNHLHPSAPHIILTVIVDGLNVKRCEISKEHIDPMVNAIKTLEKHPSILKTSKVQLQWNPGI